MIEPLIESLSAILFIHVLHVLILCIFLDSILKCILLCSGFIGHFWICTGIKRLEYRWIEQQVAVGLLLLCITWWELVWMIGEHVTITLYKTQASCGSEKLLCPGFNCKLVLIGKEVDLRLEHSSCSSLSFIICRPAIPVNCDEKTFVVKCKGNSLDLWRKQVSRWLKSQMWNIQHYAPSRKFRLEQIIWSNLWQHVTTLNVIYSV